MAEEVNLRGPMGAIAARRERAMAERRRNIVGVDVYSVAWASCDEFRDAGLAEKGARLVWGGCRF